MFTFNWKPSNWLVWWNLLYLTRLKNLQVQNFNDSCLSVSGFILELGRLIVFFFSSSFFFLFLSLLFSSFFFCFGRVGVFKGMFLYCGSFYHQISIVLSDVLFLRNTSIQQFWYIHIGYLSKYQNYFMVLYHRVGFNQVSMIFHFYISVHLSCVSENHYQTKPVHWKWEISPLETGDMGISLARKKESHKPVLIPTTFWLEVQSSFYWAMVTVLIEYGCLEEFCSCGNKIGENKKLL